MERDDITCPCDVCPIWDDINEECAEGWVGLISECPYCPFDLSLL